MRSDVILTSFYDKERISIYTKGSAIVIDQLPEQLLNNDLIVRVSDEHGRVLFSQTYYAKLPVISSFPYIPNGRFVIYILYHSKICNEQLCCLNYSQGFPAQFDSGNVKIPLPYPFDNNKQIFKNLVNSLSTKCDYRCEYSKVFIPKEVRNLALKITKNAYSRYDKIRLIHDWVASNIYYDCDSINDNSYMLAPTDSVAVLHKKRTVCVGFAKLVVTLLQSVGVPAITMDCFALGQSTDGGWEKDINLTSPPNHLIAFAYSEDRLVMMDPTWDSDNKYENGKFSHRTGYGISHQFFDSTLLFFSFTHRFIK